MDGHAEELIKAIKEKDENYLVRHLGCRCCEKNDSDDCPVLLHECWQYMSEWLYGKKNDHH